jgi:hypothetical protein
MYVKLPYLIHFHRFIIIALWIVVFLSWAAIAVLFYLYSVVANNSQTTSQLTVHFNTAASSSAIVAKKAVSFDTSGNAVMGAGRSVFKNLSPPLQASCPKYIDVDAVFDDSFIVSYQNAADLSTTLKVIKMDSSGNVASVTSTATTAQFYQVATLNQASGLFVGISQTYVTNSTFLTAGTISQANQSASIGDSVLYGCPAYGSVNPHISRISDTSFAISFFCAYNAHYDSYISTQYGTVDPVTKIIKLSDRVDLADSAIVNVTTSVKHNIVGLSDTSYFVMYALVPAIQLTTILMKVDPMTMVVTKSDNYTMTDVFMSYVPFIDVARIDSSTAMVAYVDDSTGGGISLVLVHATTDDLLAVRYGARLAVTTGATQTGKYSTYTYNGQLYVSYLAMDFSLTSVGSTTDASQSSAVLLYSDVSNDAKWTMAMVDVTPSRGIVTSAPQIVLNKDSTVGIDAQNYGLSFEAATSAASSSSVALFTTISDGLCTSVSTSSFSVLEVRAPLGGVSTAASSSSTTPVQIGGVISGLKGLTPGAVYYSDAHGNLIQGNIPYGRSAGISALSSYVETDSVIVTLDSLVGVATSTSSIALGQQ